MMTAHLLTLGNAFGQLVMALLIATYHHSVLSQLRRQTMPESDLRRPLVLFNFYSMFGAISLGNYVLITAEMTS